MFLDSFTENVASLEGFLRERVVFISVLFTPVWIGEKYRSSRRHQTTGDIPLTPRDAFSAANPNPPCSHLCLSPLEGTSVLEKLVSTHSRSYCFYYSSLCQEDSFPDKTPKTGHWGDNLLCQFILPLVSPHFHRTSLNLTEKPLL